MTITLGYNEFFWLGFIVGMISGAAIIIILAIASPKKR